MMHVPMIDAPAQPDAAAVTPRPRRRFRAVRVIVLLGILVAAIVPLVYDLAAPAVAGRRIRQRIRQHWSGSIQLGRVDIGFPGPVIVHDVVLTDSGGHAWLRVGRMTATLADWPGISPRVTALNCQDTEVTVHVDRALPLHDQVGLLHEITDLQMISADNVTVSIAANDRQLRTLNGQPLTIPGLSAVLERVPAAPGDRWRVEIHRPNGPDAAKLKGELNRIGALSSADLFVFRGRMDAFDGTTTITVSVRLPLEADASLSAQGSLFAENIDLQKLSQSLKTDESFHGRLVEGRLDVQAPALTLDKVHAQGLVLLEDVPIRRTTLLQKIGEATSPGRPPKLADSDVAAVFTVDGAMLTFHSARLGDPIMAIDVERGSTVDLISGELDMTVRTAVLSDLRGALRLMPMVHLMVGLTEALSGLDVSGTWAEPIITPAPPLLAGNGGPDFLRRMAETQGQFGRWMLTPMEKTFYALRRQHQTQPAATSPASGPRP
ncbi:hypothetical protein LCGC14_0239040 [marine sediment metagenome]|uniref:AsmA-like C-terminal domain-containing protein n=1 Tax=marine sediment metagenome TaxID=412755 RepID=A0A0F9UPI5_9ZZZZ